MEVKTAKFGNRLRLDHGERSLKFMIDIDRLYGDNIGG